MKVLLRSLLCLIALFCGLASAEVYVASTMATDPVQQSTIVLAGKYEVIQLPGMGSANDFYKITMNTKNAVYRDVTAFIVDEENLISFKQGYRYSGLGYSKAPTPFVIEGSLSSTGKKYLLIDNTYAALIKKKIDFTVESKFELDQAQQEKIKNFFSAYYAGLKKNLIFPDFDIHIEQCGKANAFS